MSEGKQEAIGADDRHLADLGYQQKLDRTLGSFATFAAGISYISILTGTFQLFYFGFGLGGPAYWWSWPLVFLGQLMVAHCFAELAAQYPVAGSIYNWSKRVGSPGVAWMAGWVMLVASIVTVAAVALAYQIILPQISSSFQFIGDGTGDKDFAQNAVLLGTVLIVFTTIITSVGVKLTARINSAGVAIELVAAVLLVILLLVSATRGPGVVLETQGLGEGRDLGYAGAFLVASLASAYVMYGFDTASSLGEESIDPRRNAPKAILRALLASFVIGGLILLFAMMAVGDINAEEIGTAGLPYIVTDVLGNFVGDLFLWCVVIAITVCCLAVHTAAVRMMFAMARDGKLPASAALCRIGASKTPVVPAVIIGAVAIAILVINISQPQIFLVLTSVAIIMIYLAYLLVTVPMLLLRLRGGWPLKDVGSSGYFTLGRLGLPVNVLAVIWGAGMAFNLAFPRKEIYNATAPFHWYLQWGAYVFIGAAILVGLAYYLISGRQEREVLEEHRAPVGAGGGAGAVASGRGMVASKPE